MYVYIYIYTYVYYIRGRPYHFLQFTITQRRDICPKTVANFAANHCSRLKTRSHCRSLVKTEAVLNDKGQRGKAGSQASRQAARPGSQAGRRRAARRQAIYMYEIRSLRKRLPEGKSLWGNVHEGGRGRPLGNEPI